MPTRSDSAESLVSGLQMADGEREREKQETLCSLFIKALIPW